MGLGGLIKNVAGTVGGAIAGVPGAVAGNILGGNGPNIPGSLAQGVGAIGGLPGSLAAQKVMGLVHDAFGGQMPSYVAPALGAGTLGALQQYSDYAHRTPEQIQQQTMAGTEQAHLNPDAMNRHAAAMGMGAQSPQLAAIQAKAQQQNSNDLNRLGRNAALSVPLQQAQSRNVLGNAYNKLANVQATQGQYTATSAMQQQKARSDALNSLIGGGAGIAGAGLAAGIRRGRGGASGGGGGTSYGFSDNGNTMTGVDDNSVSTTSFEPEAP